MTHPPKRTAMQYLRDTFPSVWKPPVVMTEWGPTTESARHQGAINMRHDSEKKAAVEELLTKKHGYAKRPDGWWQMMKWRFAPLWLIKWYPVKTHDVPLGPEMSRRQFPEAY
jgi:hypothetical protein